MVSFRSPLSARGGRRHSFSPPRAPRFFGRGITPSQSDGSKSESIQNQLQLSRHCVCCPRVPESASGEHRTHLESRCKGEVTADKPPVSVNQKRISRGLRASPSAQRRVQRWQRRRATSPSLRYSAGQSPKRGLQIAVIALPAVARAVSGVRSDGDHCRRGSSGRRWPMREGWWSSGGDDR